MPILLNPGVDLNYEKARPLFFLKVKEDGLFYMEVCYEKRSIIRIIKRKS